MIKGKSPVLYERDMCLPKVFLKHLNSCSVRCIKHICFTLNLAGRSYYSSLWMLACLPRKILNLYNIENGALRNVPNVQSAIAQGDEFTNITVAWVPIEFPPQSIDQFVAKIGPFSKAKIGTDRLQQKKDGRRIYTVKREDLIKARPPSFIYFGHYRFLIEYEGQDKTCGYCCETEHLARECEYRITKENLHSGTFSLESSSHSTTDGIKFSQNRHSDADTEELGPTPAESLLERYRQPQHSTPTAKQHDKGNATAKPNIDYYDESIIETTAPKGDSDTPNRTEKPIS